MAQITADRVKETSTTTGTGSYSLAGAVSGFRAFSSVCANTDTVYYAAVGGTDWEVGLGTWATGNTLARTTILASSNAGAAVDWIAGTREVFLTHPARAATVNVQEFGGPSTSGTSTWTKPAGAKLVHIIAHGAGDGGGCGARRASGNTAAANSGAGGNGGARVDVWISALSLGATETVVVGAGGTGAAGRTTDGQGNLGGNSGTSTSVGSFLTCFGGNFQGNDFSFFGISLSGAFGAASSVAGNNGTGGLGGGGGGSGGGVDTASPPNRAGGLAGQGSAWRSAGTTVSGSGGTGNGGVGGNGASPIDNWFSGDGGGGGGNGVTAAAGNGGNGGWPGGGGGGGGASVAGQNSGAGGNGANGFVRITTYF